MKNILCSLILFTSLGFAQVTQAGEYQCVITSTGSADCAPYYEMKHICPFPAELNELRTREFINGKLTYPAFCTACGSESKIPKNCQAGRISAFTPASTQDGGVTLEASKILNDSVAAVQDNTILQNAYQGFKIAVVRAWEWFKVVSRGESFEIESMSTPVAGVRG